MAEMDFYGMKRKDLQALCKKHEIPANSSNFDMATKLTSLLKGVERSSTEVGSCLKRKDDKIGGNDSGVGDMKIKRARLSLDEENVGLRNLVGSRVRSVENADSSESSRRILEKPARVRRTTVQKPVEDCVVIDSNPPVEKKRVRRSVKDASKVTDKPPLPPTAAVEFSDKSSGEEPKLSKRRSMRISPKNRVEATCDKPPVLSPPQPPILPSPPPKPESVVEFPGRADKGIGAPKRKVLRQRGVVVEQNEDASDEPPLPPLVPSPTAVQLARNADMEGPRLQKRKLQKTKVELESTDSIYLDTSDAFAAEETQLAKRRLLRNRETANSKTSKSPMPSNSVSKVRKPLQRLPSNSVSKVRKPLQQLPSNSVSKVRKPLQNLQPNVGNVTPKFMAAKKTIGGTEEARKTTRRSLRNKENVADFVLLTKNVVDSNQVSKKVEANTELSQESNVEEKVKKQRITRSRSQVTANAPTIHSEIENKEVLQLEEPLQPKRRNKNKKKCVEKKEEPLKGYIRNCRENDVSLHFTKRAGDTESTGNLINSVSHVGQAKGGIVFWCNGSGCFALPKW